MLTCLLVGGVLASGQTVRSPYSNTRMSPYVASMGRQTGLSRKPYGAMRSVEANAGWTRKALNILGFRRNVADKAVKQRREVDQSELTVITGGGSGIGQAAALRLAKRGQTVMIIGRRENALQETVKMAQEAGAKGRIVTVSADITTDEGREKIANSVKGMAGTVTLRGLIHNAAVNTPCKKMMDIPHDEWNRVTDINVNGPLFLTQALYPLFGKKDTDKNRIMMLSSVARTCTGLPSYGPYCVSKLTFYGLNLMFKEEMCGATKPVHTASLIPGEVDTEMQRQTAYGQADGTFPDQLVKYWRQIQESGQLLPPEVTGAFMEYVMVDTDPEDFAKDEWFIYDNKHHKNWAYEFPDVKIVEPAGLF